MIMQKRNLIIGLIFIVISAGLILNSDITPLLVPTQDAGVQRIPEMGPVYQGNLFIQELTAKKDFIYGIKVVLGNWEPVNDNDNVLFLADSSYRIVYTKKFTSKEIKVPDFYSFNFSKNLYLGKGSKYYVCVYSINGSQNNNIAIGRSEKNNTGKLYVSAIKGGDVITSLKRKDLFFEGGLCLKTYETDARGISWLKFLLLILSALIAVVILYFQRLAPFLQWLASAPDKIFLFISLSAGLLLVFITPPLQVPDENRHFYRAYQLSELNVYLYDETVPRSLTTLWDFSTRMNFRPLEKTTKNEIQSQSNTRLDPDDRIAVHTLEMVVPMIPQAFGIAIGRLFNASPLWLLYFGRILNLIAAILLIYFAIRISPVQKWVFFLLGLMPMTLYQISSLSYDAVSLSLTFFVIAFILNLAFNKQKIIRTTDLFILVVCCLLLAMCKLPYFIAGFLAILIPVTKLGSWKKYAAMLLCVIITMVIGTQIISFSRPWFKPSQSAQERLSLINQKPVPKSASDSVVAKVEARGISFDSRAQVNFIIDNKVKYLGIVFSTAEKAKWLWLQSCVGIFGWIDTFLPPGITWSYLLFLLLAATVIRDPLIKFGLFPRIVFLLLFTSGFFIILTGLYLYANDTGNEVIHAVQGRYFIPILPLFFLFFYNNWEFRQKIVKPVLQPEGKSKPDLKNLKQQPKKPGQEKFPVGNLLVLLIIVFTLISISVTFWLVLNRFYNPFT
jgi:uncharacterized membrane protein